MDINNLLGAGSAIITSEKDLFAQTLKADSFGQISSAQKSGIQKTLSQQFKELVARQTTGESSPDLETEVSQTIVENEITQTLQSQQKQAQEIKNFSSQKVLQLNADDLTEDLDSLIDPDSDQKRLEKLDKDEKLDFDLRKSAEKTEITEKTTVTGANAQLNAKWLKQALSIRKTTDELETDELDSEIKTEETPAAQKIPSKGQTLSPERLAAQQKLFSLNIRSAVKFLKNLKSFNHRFLPELVIYEEESGMVDSERTLECLGWQDVAAVKETFYTQLSNEILNKINFTKKILDQSAREGISVFHGQHPVLSRDRHIIAVENLTGELTVLDSLAELNLLRLDDNLMTVNGVAP